MKWLWKSLVVTGLRYLRTRVRLNGEESAAWLKVTQVIEAL